METKLLRLMKSKSRRADFLKCIVVESSNAADYSVFLKKVKKICRWGGGGCGGGVGEVGEVRGRGRGGGVGGGGRGGEQKNSDDFQINALA